MRWPKILCAVKWDNAGESSYLVGGVKETQTLSSKSLYLPWCDLTAKLSVESEVKEHQSNGCLSSQKWYTARHWDRNKIIVQEITAHSFFNHCMKCIDSKGFQVLLHHLQPVFGVLSSPLLSFPSNLFSTSVSTLSSQPLSFSIYLLWSCFSLFS